MKAITNLALRQLLLDLGFYRGTSTRNHHRVFQHPQSRSTIVLPENRDAQAARLADVEGVRDHLAQTGHLEAADFDHFLREGHLSTI